jgi:hypothetical protein
LLVDVVLFFRFSILKLRLTYNPGWSGLSLTENLCTCLARNIVKNKPKSTIVWSNFSNLLNSIQICRHCLWSSSSQNTCHLGHSISWNL